MNNYGRNKSVQDSKEKHVMQQGFLHIVEAAPSTRKNRLKFQD